MRYLHLRVYVGAMSTAAILGSTQSRVYDDYQAGRVNEIGKPQHMHYCTQLAAFCSTAVSAKTPMLLAALLPSIMLNRAAALHQRTKVHLKHNCMDQHYVAGRGLQPANACGPPDMPILMLRWQFPWYQQPALPSPDTCSCTALQ